MELLDKKIVELLNFRIQQEEHSYRIYEQFAMWFDNEGLPALGKLYHTYGQEELKHAGWAKDFLLAYNVIPTLTSLGSPVMEVNGIESILEDTLQHELLVASQCQALSDHAVKVNHTPLQSLALKYCTEQIEEINKATNNISSYKHCGGIGMLFEHYIAENND